MLFCMKYKLRESLSLLEALSKASPLSSRTTLRSWIKEGRVFVDDRPEGQANKLLKVDQVVAVGPKQRFVSHNMRIIYEDRQIVAIDKPVGLLSVASAFEKGETAHAILKTKYKPGKVYVVHRIDQDTSGVMLFARTEKAQQEIKDLLQEHAIDRIYYALVEGHLKASHGTWESYQFEDRNYKVHNTKDSTKGKKAITHYQVKEAGRKYTLLELRLETGRKNQIRAHCQMAGHPIVGDKKYGAHTNPIKRVCLHAYLLGLTHPATGKKMEFTSPLPPEFESLL